MNNNNYYNYLATISSSNQTSVACQSALMFVTVFNKCAQVNGCQAEMTAEVSDARMLLSQLQQAQYTIEQSTWDCSFYAFKSSLETLAV